MILRSSLKKIKQIRNNIKTSLYTKLGTPVIVYQMGKVGSTSLEKSLNVYKIKPVFHVHRMNLENISKVHQEYLDKNLTPLDESLSARLYKDIVKKHRKAKFISLVREPISRNISAFFQNLDRFIGTSCEEADFVTEELVHIFIREYKHSVPLTWFDIEMKQVLDIDVYEYPFPKEKGYLSIKKGNFELLILKLEIDDSVMEKVIRKFLDIEDFNLIRSNSAKDKIYFRTYHDFLQTIKLPKAYIEILCNSKYTRHFYSEKEIKSIESKWYKRIPEVKLPMAVYQDLLRHR